jgi:hypothetical protein
MGFVLAGSYVWVVVYESLEYQAWRYLRYRYWMGRMADRQVSASIGWMAIQPARTN